MIRKGDAVEVRDAITVRAYPGILRDSFVVHTN